MNLRSEVRHAWVGSESRSRTAAAYPPIELREMQVFIALTEELHFGRTAERLGLTSSRVSQIARQVSQGLHKSRDRMTCLHASVKTS